MISVSPYNHLRLHDPVEVMINPMNPKESYKISYEGKIEKQRMKLSDYIAKIIVLIAITVVFIFVIFVVLVLAIGKFMK